MNAFHLYIQLKPYLPESSRHEPPMSESTFIECVHAFDTFLKCFMKQKYLLKTCGTEDEDLLVEEFALKLNIHQKKHQDTLKQTFTLLGHLLNELGRPDLSSYVYEYIDEGHPGYSIRNKKLGQSYELWLFLNKATSILVRDIKVLGIQQKKLVENLGVFQFLSEQILRTKKKKPKSTVVPPIKSNTPSKNADSKSLGPSDNYDVNVPSSPSKIPSSTSPCNWSNIGAFRLAYLQSQNDQLFKQLQCVQSLKSAYPPYPVRQAKEDSSHRPSSARNRNHLIEQSLYQVYPSLLQMQHYLDIFHPSISMDATQGLQDCLSNLKKPLAHAIQVCTLHDYETRSKDQEYDDDLFDIDTCIEEATGKFTISSAFRDRLKQCLSSRFDKIGSRMDILRLENQAYNQEIDRFQQTMSCEVEAFRNELSKLQDAQKASRTQLSTISYEMTSLLSQMENLKLEYSEGNALTMLQVVETLLQRWQPELTILAHPLPLPTSISPSPNLFPISSAKDSTSESVEQSHIHTFL